MRHYDRVSCLTNMLARAIHKYAGQAGEAGVYHAGQDKTAEKTVPSDLRFRAGLRSSNE